jgi:rhomboid family protein
MGVLASLARLRVTFAYAIVVTCVTLTLLALGPDVQEQAISHASTNLHNLSHGHIGTLLDSAFVVDAGPIYEWLPGLVCVLALAELLWGSWRLIVAFAVGHVGATLLVAIGLTAAVELNWLDAGSVTRATDVGMSYGAAGVLGALTAAVPARWRPTWIGWWLGVGVVAVVVSRDFTDAGHFVALALGMLASTRFGTPECWTRARVALLAVAAAFGYLLFANTPLLMVIATVLGVLVVANVEIWRAGNACEAPTAHHL